MEDEAENESQQRRAEQDEFMLNRLADDGAQHVEDWRNNKQRSPAPRRGGAGQRGEQRKRKRKAGKRSPLADKRGKFRKVARRGAETQGILSGAFLGMALFPG